MDQRRKEEHLLTEVEARQKLEDEKKPLGYRTDRSGNERFSLALAWIEMAKGPSVECRALMEKRPPALTSILCTFT